MKAKQRKDKRTGQRKIPRIHAWNGMNDRGRQLAELKTVRTRTHNRRGQR